MLLLVINSIGCQPARVDQSPTQQANPATSIPTSTKIVRLAWFYKPPRDGQLAPLVNYFDFFILTHKDEPTRDWLKSNGVTAPFAQYLLLTEIMDPGDCSSTPYGNQVAYKAGDFCAISQQHPDWFLLDANGNRIQSGSGDYYMDPGNEGYREFWLSRAREMQETFGWDNLFIDNVEASREKFLNKASGLATYPDDASYQSAVEGFLAFIRQNYFAPRGRLMFGNIVSNRDETTWFNYIQYLDGAMIEAFATGWSGDYRSPFEWETQMSMAEKALTEDKTMILVSRGNQSNTDLQRFAFASYLLIANGNAVFRYTDPDSYSEPWVYSDYQIDLGNPLGNRYRSDFSWRRDFTRGYVTVNPWTHSAQIVVTP